MKKTVNWLFVLVLLLMAKSAWAQNAVMADGLRSEGKIYVVVLMIVIVLAGLIAYLFLIDRKLNKMEKMFQDKFKTKS